MGTADGMSALESDSAAGDASGVPSSLGGTSCQNLPTADDQSARISDPRFESAWRGRNNECCVRNVPV